MQVLSASLVLCFVLKSLLSLLFTSRYAMEAFFVLKSERCIDISKTDNHLFCQTGFREVHLFTAERASRTIHLSKLFDFIELTPKILTSTS